MKKVSPIFGLAFIAAALVAGCGDRAAVDPSTARGAPDLAGPKDGPVTPPEVFIDGPIDGARIPRGEMISCRGRVVCPGGYRLVDDRIVVSIRVHYRGDEYAIWNDTTAHLKKEADGRYSFAVDLGPEKKPKGPGRCAIRVIAIGFPAAEKRAGRPFAQVKFEALP